MFVSARMSISSMVPLVFASVDAFSAETFLGEGRDVIWNHIGNFFKGFVKLFGAQPRCLGLAFNFPGDDLKHSSPQKRIHGHTFGLCLSNQRDRKSTRLNSSHVRISYAVF